MDLVSIVVPVYQNKLNLRDTASKLLSLSEKINDALIEIVFVDDGSTDGSRDILQELSTQEPSRISVVFLTRNFGQTPATSAGLRNARGACVVIISADLQEPWQEIATMVAHWRAGSKFVIGNRIGRDESIWHRSLSGIYWYILRRFAMKGFPELGFDFCLLDRAVVNEASRLTESNTSIFPLLYWLGYRPTLVPIHRSRRTVGTSQWNLRKKIALTMNVIFSFTSLPSLFTTSLALIVSVATALVVAWCGVRLALWGGGLATWEWSCLLALVATSCVLVSLAVVCEYLSRILDEVRGRPTFVTERHTMATLTLEKDRKE
jgi:dolichol-phosphate mannosyltransferase